MIFFCENFALFKIIIKTKIKIPSLVKITFIVLYLKFVEPIGFIKNKSSRKILNESQSQICRMLGINLASFITAKDFVVVFLFLFF